MLVLSRKETEKILIGDNVEIEIVRVAGNRVILGITAPKDMKVLRGELQPKACDHVWGTDGMHSNVFCKKCFISRADGENHEDHD